MHTKIRRKKKAALLSVGSNAILVVAKLIIGVLTGSVSIISEAIHSGNDLLASVIAYFAVRVADNPPDWNHPYGHGKAESVSGFIEASLILIAAVWIVIEAVKKIIYGSHVEMAGVGAAVMGLSVILNLLVSRYLFRVAKEEDSLALLTDAHHLSTDIITAAGVGVGLLLVWSTDWHILDPIAAIIVACVIARVGWQLILVSVRHLMDEQLPQVEIKQIEAILADEPRVQSWHNLRTRRLGSFREIDVHIVMERYATLLEAHALADHLEKQIAERFTPANVMIHVDPYDEHKDRPVVDKQ